MSLVRTPSGLVLDVDHEDVHLPDWTGPTVIRRKLMRHYPDWRMERYEQRGARFTHQGTQTTIVVSAGRWEKAGVWVHASISHPTVMPTYDELVMLHGAVFGDRFAYQVFAPPAKHVNGHPFCLHLWGRDGDDEAIPNFGKYGVI